MSVNRCVLVAGLLILCLVTASCGWQTLPESPEKAPDLEADTSPLVQQSPLATALPESLPPPTTEILPTEASPQGQAALPLVILHTNDNWGETEPCG